MKAYDHAGISILQGDVRDCLRELPAESVQTVVTSPPYFALRNYGVDGQIGLESSPEEYVSVMVDVFKEVRRVLRDDGTVWLNLGDSYGRGDRTAWAGDATRDKNGKQSVVSQNGNYAQSVAFLPAKQLVGIPWRVAFALQADGWYLRSAIPWLKRSAMPESVTDRPSTALEYVFLLTKSKGYYFDADAIRKANGSEASWAEYAKHLGKDWANDAKDIAEGRGHFADGIGQRRVKRDAPALTHPLGRNRRNSDWWYESLDAIITDQRAYLAHLEHIRDNSGVLLDGDEILGIDITPQGFAEAHFATFGQKFVEPMILAGTSEAGCCSACGKALVRVVEKQYTPSAKSRGRAGNGTALESGAGNRQGGWNDCPSLDKNIITLGFRAACKCPPQPAVPCKVLDPFLGSGTTLKVAKELGRHGYGIDLKPEYIEMAIKRLQQDILPLSVG